MKAYRILASDRLTLVVEVRSEPPAIFEWFVNDVPVEHDRRRFRVRHGVNITTLMVCAPEQVTAASKRLSLVTEIANFRA